MNHVIFQLLLVLTFFNSSTRQIPANEDSLTGDWIGNYTWECLKGGAQQIKLSLNDNNGVLTGTIELSNQNFQIQGYRIADAELGEWKYEKGHLSKSGKQIYLQILNPKNSKATLNIFSGELKNDVISGITMNGEGCSAVQGPSGSFKIQKIHF